MPRKLIKPKELDELQDLARTIGIETSDTYSINVADRLKRLPPYLFGKLNHLRYEKRRAGIDVIDLGMGNPIDATPEPIVDKLCEAVKDARNHRYSVSVGLYNLRRDCANHYEQIWGVKLDPSKEIIATIGSKEGFSHMCLAMLGPGDTALVPNPAFPIHVYSVALAGANVVSYPVNDEEQTLRDISFICKVLYPKPRVLIINYPHNPSTATVELAFFEEVVGLAKKHNFLVIHDFAYSETTFDGWKAPSFLQAKGAIEVGCEFTTLSKNYSMAGWRIGFCAGHPDMVRALGKIKGYYDYGIFQPVQIAAIIAFRHCQEYVEKMKQIYQQRRDVLCDGLARYGWNIPKPKGTMFVWAPIPEEFRHIGSINFALKLIEEAEVAVAPGRGFGDAGEGFLRIALVENDKRLKQAVRQIGRCIRGGKG
ncbi:MAG TPA: aminotransferase class I/II-fold pyridoxal phosphate-dependent enzyme [Planctomycetota bacterium]|nr:aminotransferase class I/II-fold pyridoxal phosphate-dependent enzyme [Planctomycetota bacterium]